MMVRHPMPRSAQSRLVHDAVTIGSTRVAFYGHDDAVRLATYTNLEHIVVFLRRFPQYPA